MLLDVSAVDHIGWSTLPTVESSRLTSSGFAFVGGVAFGGSKLATPNGNPIVCGRALALRLGRLLGDRGRHGEPRYYF